MSEPTEFVKALENRTSLKIACLEEIAYMGYIDRTRLIENINALGKSSYGDYLKKL